MGDPNIEAKSGGWYYSKYQIPQQLNPDIIPRGHDPRDSRVARHLMEAMEQTLSFTNQLARTRLMSKKGSDFLNSFDIPIGKNIEVFIRINKTRKLTFDQLERVAYG